MYAVNSISKASLTLAQQWVYAMAQIWRANDGRTRARAWGCVATSRLSEVVHAMLWRKF